MNRKQLAEMGVLPINRKLSEPVNFVKKVRTSRNTTNEVHTRLTCNISEPEVFNSDYLNHGYCRAFNNNFND
jgi:hypothetical protein